MSNSRADVLRAARDILTEHSLADLSMRRLAADLGVRPNALYWHFPNKQTLLAALSDDILGQIPPAPDALGWDERLAHLATGLRAALLDVPDSAEIVSSSWASGLSARTIAAQLAFVAHEGGLSDRDAQAVATAVCQLTIGLTIEEQTRSQMERLQVLGPSGRDFTGEFLDGLSVILDGARLRAERLSATTGARQGKEK
ncbi:TetR family transcriptional regulator [Gordonia sp. HNM0687]|uniref:TetR family transcriptional regulator n=1 Tax=Gordonia mangrovi TaxID=2665643 RepID=A0A6L7GNI8_9ACTN|nr:TetR family transcriptional regulator [Gordonia mangrovi]MXP21163.1 TetR family transcriptional regulator [Gordonia mangrovi]UVF78302.1 TetR family transcriptional regulator [Gordonia mangrovi]